MSLGRLWRDCSGNMAILFACGFALSAAISVVAIDTAALYHERRQLQAGVDLAAIAAVSDPARSAEIAQSVLVDAGLIAPSSTAGLTVSNGHYDPQNSDIEARFGAGRLPINAVKVTLERPGTLHFAGQWLGSPSLAAKGTAAVRPEVSFSVGSRLASLNGGIANAILSKLTGTTVALSVLDYAAIAGARVDAFGFLDALADELGVTVGSYDQVLQLEASAGTVAGALSRLVNGTARTALHSIGLSGNGTRVPLKRLFSLGELELGSEGAVAGLSLSAMEVLTAAAALGSGDRQLSLPLSANLPGLLSLGLDLVIGEPPQGYGWFAIGPVGTTIRTAQLRLRIKAKLLGGPVLLGAGVNLPLWLDLAPSEARVVSATCPSSVASLGSATVEVRPGVLKLALGEVSDRALGDFGTQPATNSARLIDLLLLRVTGAAQIQASQTTPIRLDFSTADIGAGTQKTARTQTLITSLAGSLLSGMTLQVEILGLGLSPSSVIAQAVRTLIAPLAPTLDMTINAVFSTLGLGVGEADVRVYGVRCHKAVLVE